MELLELLHRDCLRWSFFLTCLAEKKDLQFSESVYYALRIGIPGKGDATWKGHCCKLFSVMLVLEIRSGFLLCSRL